MMQDNLVMRCDRINTAPEKKLKESRFECGFPNFQLNITMRE